MDPSVGTLSGFDSDSGVSFLPSCAPLWNREVCQSDSVINGQIATYL
jgi:hypothetical protein